MPAKKPSPAKTRKKTPAPTGTLAPRTVSNADAAIVKGGPSGHPWMKSRPGARAQ
jgi:hypothetical protein